MPGDEVAPSQSAAHPMTARNDVDALLAAVRALVSDRSASSAAPKLLLRSEDRVESPSGQGAADGGARVETVLRDFARLTRIADAEPPQSRDDQPLSAQDKAPRPAGPDTGAPDVSAAAEADHETLRQLVRDILGEDLRQDLERHIAETVERLLREKEDRPTDPAG